MAPGISIQSFGYHTSSLCGLRYALGCIKACSCVISPRCMEFYLSLNLWDRNRELIVFLVRTLPTCIASRRKHPDCECFLNSSRKRVHITRPRKEWDLQICPQDIEVTQQSKSSYERVWFRMRWWASQQSCKHRGRNCQLVLQSHRTANVDIDQWAKSFSWESRLQQRRQVEYNASARDGRKNVGMSLLIRR